MSLKYMGSSHLLRMTPKDMGMILNGLRRAFSRSQYARRLREAAKVSQKGPRGGKLYRCILCNEVFNSSKINLDHVSPVVAIGKKYTDYTWDELVTRLWCSEDNLQVLCTDCHKKKTKKEASLRKKARANLAK